MWDREQQRRLAWEKRKFSERAPRFTFHNLLGDTYITGWQTSESGRTRCKLRIDIPSRYPDEVPELVVVSPHLVWKRWHCGTINSEGVSHTWHTLSNGPDGCVSVCHESDWDASMTCLTVAKAGSIWVTAYDAHLRTGITIAEYIDQMKQRLFE